MRDYPKPKQIENTDNFREAGALSARFKELGQLPTNKKKKVAVIGGGLSGLAAARYLVDAGHEPIVYEARNVLGGKVSAWKDKDGDWIETGLHIFFGAYPNMMNLFKELNIEDRLQWKIHQMIFAMQELPGEFTSFDFIPGIPAPFNFGLAILSNQKMLTLWEKLQTAPPLLPMLIEGQEFIDKQDELSVTQFMRKYGMPERINEEVFIAMAKALDFIDPGACALRSPPPHSSPTLSHPSFVRNTTDKLSMTVVLTAMNRFLNEDDGLQMAFLDGNQPERLCAPMKEYIEARGGEVRTKAAVKVTLTPSALPPSLPSSHASPLTLTPHTHASLTHLTPSLFLSPWRGGGVGNRHEPGRLGEAPADAQRRGGGGRRVRLRHARGRDEAHAAQGAAPLCTHAPFGPHWILDPFPRCLTFLRHPSLVVVVRQAWANMPHFRQMDELEGIPVINIHMWFDRKLKNVDHLCFSRSPLLSVYADMSTTCKEYYDENKSMLELVFAPCSPIAGGNVNWISKSDEEIIDATMGELERLFPTEVRVVILHSRRCTT
jgi:uncharacterized protein with NAD-binding domain and iron-sulfur cluster